MDIKILTTGGTIGGLEYENIDNRSEEKSVNISSFLKSANPSFQYKIVDVFNKDSRFINEDDRKMIAEKITSSPEEKILITHGTYTMPETAVYLGKRNFNKTIVLVGSFILGSEVNTDAPFNLGYAIAALQLLNPGVYIAMNGKIFNWNNVTKNITTNRFEEPNE
ncbi:asparaginase domain-containing protein [Xanthomarina gelatinilytica]|uniref:asparaginase domain-containing protein n=1 Tax=Xanthomarina gelatinilytica TaxID=1137281 RepID=UPI003AA87955